MKVLFLDPEQYVDFENEPSNYQLRLPFLNAGPITNHCDFVYQRVLRAQGRDAMNAAAIAEFEKFRPDLVVNSLAWWNECLEPATLDAMRRQGAKVLTVFWDTWINPLPHEIELFLASDVLLIMDSLAGYLKYRLLREHLGRGPLVVFSPIAVFTDVIHRAPAEQDIDVLMIGSDEGQRVELTRRLDENLSKRGIRFVRLGGLVDDDGRTSSKWVDWKSYAQAINRAKICLSSQTKPDRLQIKGKVFDFLASGAFCLTDDNPELFRFLPQDCVAAYRGTEDCIAQIERYLNAPQARQTIADAGHAWLQKTYDYRAFWADIAASLGHGPNRLPVLPGIDDAYGAFRTSQPLVARSQLATLGQLAHIVARHGNPHRLPVRALGSYCGVNILEVDSRFVVATTGLDVDFMEIGGEAHVLTPETGLTKLIPGEPTGNRPALMVRAESVEAAKRLIDALKIGTN